SDEMQPVSDGIVHAFVDFLPEALRHRRAFSRGAGGALQAGAPNNSGKIKIAVGRIVHGIAEDAQALGFEEYGAVDDGIRGGRDGEESAGEIGELKFAAQPAQLSASDEPFYFGTRARRDDG